MTSHSRTRRRCRTAAALLTVLAATAAAPAATPASPAAGPAAATTGAEGAPEPEPTRPRAARTLHDPEIVESSGLARSGLPRPVLFTHNDSGDTARVFAVGAGGRTRGELGLRGVRPVDWEDIASGPGRSLWIGDIGDNGRDRRTITVHRVLEPRRLSIRWTTPRSYRLAYPDGAHDAEALLVRPRTGRIFVVTKRGSGAGIYRAPKRLSTERVNRLTWVRSAPAEVTAGSFAPRGGYFVLGTYDDAWVYRGMRAAPRRLALPHRGQGESLEVLARRTVVVGSEGRRSEVQAVRVPRSVLRPPGRPTSPGRRVAATRATGSIPSPDGRSSGSEIPGWNLELSEDFDGALDPAVWNVRDDTSNDNEDSHLLARNTEVSGGSLRIEARLEQVRGRRYTSGYVDTNDRYALPDHFRVEVRAKVPMEQGMWAAPLWLRPADQSTGEIDLVETYGMERDAPRVHHTIHTSYGHGHQQDTDGVAYADLGDPEGTGWHTYVVEKTPGLVVMYTDGVETGRFSSGDPSWFDRYYEAGKSWELRINLQVGGDWGGPPDAGTDWSRTTMLVDRIRTWTPR